MSKKGIRSFFNKSFRFGQRWFKVILEVIGFSLVVSEVIPRKWIDSSWAFFVLMLIALLGLSISNFLLIYKKDESYNKLFEESTQEKNSLNNRIAALEKKARYASVISILNSAFNHLHEATRKNFDDKTKYHEYFVICCHNIEKAFTIITNHECHVSIKMILFPQGQIPSYTKAKKNIQDILLRTYCRSSSSSAIRAKIDHENIKHPVKENTDFEHIYTKKENYYFCNDLTSLDVYKNSSLKLKTGESVIYPKSMDDQAKKAWPLEYKATMVAPILPTIQDTNDQKIILGFLCVDCKTPNVFDIELDPHIMMGFADGIYNSFVKLFIVPKTNH